MQQNRRAASISKTLAVAFVAAALGLVYTAGKSSASTNAVEVSFINVGQGGAALLSDGNGFDVLIDGAKASAGPTVVAYLRERGVDDIEVMVASHAHADHIGGLIDVLELADIPVEAVLYNGYPGTTQTWHTFATAVANEGLSLTPAQYPATYTWGLMTAYVLNPAPGLSDPEQNDVSVVILVKHGQVDFIFTGDISSNVEATVMARATPPGPQAEILKVSHHGSKYSSSDSFLAAVQPDVAVISVGANPYGHPADETLQRLAAAGARILRTDIDGTIVIVSDGVEYETRLSIYHIFLPMAAK